MITPPARFQLYLHPLHYLPPSIDSKVTIAVVSLQYLYAVLNLLSNVGCPLGLVQPQVGHGVAQQALHCGEVAFLHTRGRLVMAMT